MIYDQVEGMEETPRTTKSTSTKTRARKNHALVPFDEEGEIVL